VVSLGGVTIPEGGSASVTFAPITFDLLEGVQPDDVAFTANMTMVFSGRRANDLVVEGVAYKQLFVEACF
jgi:hypothetical protein